MKTELYQFKDLIDVLEAVERRVNVLDSPKKNVVSIVIVPGKDQFVGTLTLKGK